MDKKPEPRPRRNMADILDGLPEDIPWVITDVQTQRKRAERRDKSRLYTEALRVEERVECVPREAGPVAAVVAAG